MHTRLNIGTGWHITIGTVNGRPSGSPTVWDAPHVLVRVGDASPASQGMETRMARILAVTLVAAADLADLMGDGKQTRTLK